MKKKYTVIDQLGLDNTGRKSLPGQKNELFSAVSSAFYPLRAAVKPLHLPLPVLSFPHLHHLLHCLTFHLLKIIPPSFTVPSSLYSTTPHPPHNYLLVTCFSSTSLRLPSFFHLFSTLSFPLLTLSEIDFQLRAECLEASIFPNLTPIQPE